MPSRDSLHRLVDHLLESELNRAERVLEVLKETAEPPTGWTMLPKMMNQSQPKKRRRSLKPGKNIPTDEV